MADADTAENVLIEVKRSLASEQLPMNNILDDLKLSGTLTGAEKQAIKKEPKEDRLDTLVDILEVKLPAAYEAFRESLKKRVPDLYRTKITPIEEEYNYNTNTPESGELPQQAEPTPPSKPDGESEQDGKKAAEPTDNSKPNVKNKQQTASPIPPAKSGELPQQEQQTDEATDGQSEQDRNQPSEPRDKSKANVKPEQDTASPTDITDQWDVMISYNWGAQERMLKLKDELVKTGFRVWMDVERMRDNMDQTMAKAVEGSAVIVMCCSKKYQDSKNCRKEAQYADFLNKDIIRLQYDSSKPSDWLGLMICNMLYYDVRTEEAMVKSLPEIIKAIDEKLSSKKTQQVPRPQAPTTSHRYGDLVQKIAKDLRAKYERIYCKKQIIPWKRNEWLDLDDLYVPMSIDDTSSGSFVIQERLKSYEDVLKIDGRRFLLVGDPGRGKSVFCAKIAYDWCREKPLSAIKHTKLLFILQLGLIDHTTNLEDAIREQLLSTSIAKDPAVNNDTLHQIISDFKESCLIVFDSFDETEMKILAKTQDIGNMVRIIQDDHLRECRVLVTTRPWREGEIINQYPTYKRLQLKPLNKSDVLDLVRNYFNRSKDDLAAPGLIKLGKRLSGYIQRNEITIDLSSPLIVVMVSWLFEESHGREIPKRLGELYHAVLSMMGKSQLSSPGSVEDLIDKLGSVVVTG
ncbi:uncharacterized protein [Amphiura filiformis]|uniref:uncharacterized protein n=1 Tax=Amphiura filiformis TaxID=82378 RepID=UPI003B20E290